MATIYDSTNPADIPAAPDGLVFAYNDGLYSQVAAVRARFPVARVVTISAVGRASADVVDVEPGCVWPIANAVAYVRRERAAGNDPAVYCGRANWPAVIAAFDQAGMAQPRYWVAHYTNTPHLCSSSCYPLSVGSLVAVATQYGGDLPGHYDITVTDGAWPGGVTTLGGQARVIEPTAQPSKEDMMSALSDEQQQTLYNNIAVIRQMLLDATPPQTLLPLALQQESYNRGIVIQSLVSQLLARHPGDVDVAGLAASIADALDDDLAAKVVDVLSKRLAA